MFIYLFSICLLIELLVLIRISRYLSFINIHLTDLVFYFKDSFFNDESNNYLNTNLEQISHELHILNSKIN